MRVLVVRAAHQAEATARALAEAGHLPILAPILVIVPTDAKAPAMRPDALLVTSCNAVSALARHREAFADVPVFAVGPRTAEALGAAGFRDVTAASGDGAALARLVSASMPPGARLLHVAGRERRPEPARSLVAEGYVVETFEAYAAEPAAALPPIARDALETASCDAALHYSPRSAALLSRLVSDAGLAEPFAALMHVCLSPNVAAALQGVPRERIAIAEAPDEAHLLAWLAKPGRAD